MGNTRFQKPVAVFAMAFALVATGCGRIETIKVEATDLSAVSVDSERAMIEQALGRPTIVQAENGITVAVYRYTKGKLIPYRYPEYVESQRGGPSAGAYEFGGALFNLLIIAVDYSIESAKAHETQRAKLVALFDANDRLVYAAAINNEEVEDTSKLKELAALYTSAKAGDMESQYRLGKRALIEAQRQKLFEQAAFGGIAASHYDLGILATDEREAIRHFRAAANSDYTPAQIKLARSYRDGIGVVPDLAKAAFWFGKAVQAGDDDAATELTEVEAVLSNLSKAERGEPEAQNAVGNAYSIGRGVKRDVAAAVQWWRTASEAGHAGAQGKLARSYRNGNGGRVDVDFVMAKVWAEKAAAQDDPEGLFQLAHIFRMGEGVEVNMLKAISLYERAAERGNDSAPFFLGYIYHHSSAVQHDPIKAHMWYSLAASLSGSLGAANKRDLIAKKMTQGQLAEATRMAREWLKARPQ